MEIENNHIIIFDGVCNFCNGAVNFILKRDLNKCFVFTPMQSNFTKTLIDKSQRDKQIRNMKMFYCWRNKVIITCIIAMKLKLF